VREFYAICGRGSGKSRIVALLACFFASREYRRVPGESIFIGIFAPDRKAASITHRYVVGLLKSVPALAALIVAEQKDSIELSNGVIIEVITASIAAPRGRAYALAICEEAAFLPTDDSANPDVELLRAVRPALARVPGSLLAVVSSPYARKGVLWHAWMKYHDQPDSDVVLVQAATRDLNPTFDTRAIEKALEEDPASAGAEYLAQFRADVESYVSHDVVVAATITGRHELPPVADLTYTATVDPSGGRSDSFTLAVGHRDGACVVIDALRETRPDFSPAAVVTEFAALLRAYGVKTVWGDKYAGEFPRELFREHGIDYELLPKSKSECYVDALALLNSRRIALLDHPRANRQLVSLERTPGRGGKDTIDHPRGSHDDLANVICALAVQLTAGPIAFDWQACGLSSPCTWGDDDEWGPNGRYGHLPPEVRQREREAQEIRRRIGWEVPGGTLRI
jgi:hypothetical protein